MYCLGCDRPVAAQKTTHGARTRSAPWRAVLVALPSLRPRHGTVLFAEGLSSLANQPNDTPAHGLRTSDLRLTQRGVVTRNLISLMNRKRSKKDCPPGLSMS